MLIKTKRGARRIRNQRVIDRRFVVTDYEIRVVDIKSDKFSEIKDLYNLAA